MARRSANQRRHRDLTNIDNDKPRLARQFPLSSVMSAPSKTIAIAKSEMRQRVVSMFLTVNPEA